jgi:hypothetical protein
LLVALSSAVPSRMSRAARDAGARGQTRDGRNIGGDRAREGRVGAGDANRVVGALTDADRAADVGFAGRVGLRGGPGERVAVAAGEAAPFPLVGVAGRRAGPSAVMLGQRLPCSAKPVIVGDEVLVGVPAIAKASEADRAADTCRTVEARGGIADRRACAFAVEPGRHVIEGAGLAEVGVERRRRDRRRPGRRRPDRTRRRRSARRRTCRPRRPSRSAHRVLRGCCRRRRRPCVGRRSPRRPQPPRLAAQPVEAKLASSALPERPR